jgi:leucyl-tRNA synthetase
MGDLLDAPWPQADPAALVQDEIEIAVQVNGKLRGAIRVPTAADDAAITAAALADANVAKFVAGQPLKFSKVLRNRNLMTLAV